MFISTLNVCTHILIDGHGLSTCRVFNTGSVAAQGMVQNVRHYMYLPFLRTQNLLLIG